DRPVAFVGGPPTRGAMVREMEHARLRAHDAAGRRIARIRAARREQPGGTQEGGELGTQGVEDGGTDAVAERTQARGRRGHAGRGGGARYWAGVGGGGGPGGAAAGLIGPPAGPPVGPGPPAAGGQGWC